MMDVIPPFEVRTRLGAGGGGEVWAGVDVLTGEPCAIKVLAADSSSGELKALLTEATALSGLEGLGLPRVLAFGTLKDGRRYLVREMIDGKSIESYLERPEANARLLLGALVTAFEQLGVLHRAGMFHGDIKPANVIVDPDGHGRLVDLGLAVRSEGGRAVPRGLTPAFAAPELFRGEPISSRTEVFSAGRSIAGVLEHANLSGLAKEEARRVHALVQRATDEDPAARFPSIDELRVELMQILGRAEPMFPEVHAWPILGIDEGVAALVEEVRKLPPGRALVVHGPPRSGRSTLLRRLAWTLGASGTPTALFDVRGLPDVSLLASALLRLAKLGTFVIALDDAEALSEPSVREATEAVLRAGSRLVVLSESAAPAELSRYVDHAAAVGPLGRHDAEMLVRSSVPSLALAHVSAIVEASKGRPGVLRGIVEKIGSRVIVAASDLEECMHASDRDEVEGPSSIEALERAVARGRFIEVQRLLGALTPRPKQAEERARIAIAESKSFLARGDAAKAATILDEVERDCPPRLVSAWRIARARAYLRLGDFPKAKATAISGPKEKAEAEALAVAGVAAAYSGEEDAFEYLGRARDVAVAQADARTLGIVFGSFGIAEQRAGRPAEARKHFAASLEHSEAAADAWTLTTTHLNLAVLLQGEGELGEAVRHLEAGADMARRAGTPLLLAQALLNLANLDLYLGRLSRANHGIASIEESQASLSGPLHAQFLGLLAVAREREGQRAEAAKLYETCAIAYDALGRSLDAFEARLARVAMLAEDNGVSRSSVAGELDALFEGRTDADQGEHRAMAMFVAALVRARENRTDEALVFAERAIEAAEHAARTEWKWRALSLRASLNEQKGATVAAKRDREGALETLERIAARLPADLADVFWSEKERANVRAKLTAPSPTEALPRTRPRASGTSTHTWVLSQLSEDRLQRILEITKELARERDITALLRGIVDHAISLSSAERGLVLLIDDDGAPYVHTSRDRKEEDGEYVAFSKSVAEKVIASGEPVVSTSARDDAMFREAASVHKMMIQSVVCVPIRGTPPALRPIGALYLETRLRSGVRFNEELPMLSAFADQAAIAIEYARLIDENKRRAEELEVTNAELERAKERLASTLGRRTEQLVRTRRDLREARAQLSGHFGYGSLVGTSAAMRSLYALIDRVKSTDIPVLILGESGTGKEVVARTIHTQSDRAKRPFLGINCGAIPHNLLESELFGHMRGAFTGADRDRKGVFKQAEDGTLLLDEIGELPLGMQAGLLRVLQEKLVRPLGSEREEVVSARVIAATNRSLEEMVEKGEFREDLYYRLNVVTVRVPALRERREDIAPLADHFMTLFASRYGRERKALHKDAMARLMRYEFPGNVRELEHILLGAWLMGDDDEIGEGDLEIHDSRGGPRSAPPPPSRRVDRAESENEGAYKRDERERILRALKDANWNRLRAAEILGMPRRTLYRRLKEYGIQ